MKSILTLAALVLAVGAASVCAADKKPESKAKPYKLEVCIVQDEKLGEMGEPFVLVHEGQEFKLCCKSCKKDFDKDPAKFVKKLAEAEAKAKAKK